MKNFCFMLLGAILLPASLWADQITICHGTASSTNPYNTITIDDSAWNEVNNACPQKSTHCRHKHDDIKVDSSGIAHPDFLLDEALYGDCKNQYLKTIAPARVAAVFENIMVGCLSTKDVQFIMADGSSQLVECPGIKDVPVGEGEHAYIRVPIGAQSINISSVNANLISARVSYFKESHPEMRFTKIADAGGLVSTSKTARLDVAGSPDFAVDCTQDAIASYGRLPGGTPFNPKLGFSEKVCPDSGELTRAQLFGYTQYVQVLCPDDGNLRVKYIDPTLEESAQSGFHTYSCSAGTSVNLNLDIIPLEQPSSWSSL